MTTESREEAPRAGETGAGASGLLVLEVHLTAGAFTLTVTETFQGRAMAIVGASGAGKTTLLEVIAGLRRPDRGRVVVAGRVLFDSDAGVDVPPRRRRIGYVPQDLALFPHLDVRRNVLFGADRSSAATAAASPLTFERVIEVLDLGGLLARDVETLSGGERQRVALARALLSAPDLLLLDEPLAALHTALRDRILADLQRVRDELRMPLIYVSHDAGEVRAMAEWAIVLEAGRVIASGEPTDVLAV